MTEVKPSVLITGANGFIGARLCNRFLLEGFRVVAGVRASSDLSALESFNLDYRKGDLTDAASLSEMATGVDYIVHNAGIVKAKERETFFRINEGGTRSLMEAVYRSNPGVRKVAVMSSLAGVGPSKEGRPVTESDPPHPVTTYGESKIAGEKAALEYADRLPVVALRPPGVYGPGDREIFDFFKAVHGRIRPKIGDGRRRLQLVHVDDLVRGVFLAVTTETPSGEAYFVAEKDSYAMGELVDILVKVIGRKAYSLPLPASVFRAVATVSETVFKAVGATPMLTREKAGELLGWWEVSTDKAARDFGFRSEIAFERGARETYEWYLRKGWLR